MKFFPLIFQIIAQSNALAVTITVIGRVIRFGLRPK